MVSALKISSFPSVGEICGIGRYTGQALPKDVCTLSSVLHLLFACGVINTLERYEAKAAAFFLYVTPKFPSSCRNGGICTIGLLSSLVPFQTE